MGYGTILLVSESLPGKILVVRLGAIGDVVNALVFAAAVKEASPEVEIGWVVHPLARPLVEGHPCVDRVHVWHKRLAFAFEFKGWKKVATVQIEAGEAERLEIELEGEAGR